MGIVLSPLSLRIGNMAALNRALAIEFVKSLEGSIPDSLEDVAYELML